MKRHLLIAIGNVTDEVRGQVAADIVADNANDWFNYAETTWLLCTAKEPAHYRAMLNARVAPTHGYFMIMDISHAEVNSGHLPEEAWRWLRRHHLFRGVNNFGV